MTRKPTKRPAKQKIAEHKIIDGLKEAVDYAKGDKSKGRKTALSREDKAALREIREVLAVRNLAADKDLAYAQQKAPSYSSYAKDEGDPTGSPPAVSFGVPTGTRTPYDLVMAVCGLAVFFMVTHGLMGWPV